MRILELELQDLRDFRGRHRLSFLDDAGDSARPVTAVVSADPRRRATALEAIEASVSYAVDPRHPRGLVREAFLSGWLQLSLELPWQLVLQPRLPLLRPLLLLLLVLFHELSLQLFQQLF